jgi:ubiquinone/menaquinone biosynthesis C-methylase UbiE
VIQTVSRRAFFNEIADSWDKRFQTQELTKFLEQLVPNFGLSPGQKVLDVGAGTGILIPFLLRAVGPTGQIEAVDYAEKMANICRSKYAHTPNVSVSVQEAEKLDFPAQTFDAVICFGSFPHIENKEEALRQMNRVLKPDGKLVIAHALSSEEIEAHHHNASEAVAHDVLPERTSMKQLLRQAGICIVDKPGCYLCTSNKGAKSADKLQI